MNTATEGIAQLGPLMPGNVFTIADSVYAASQCTVKDPGNNKINWQQREISVEMMFGREEEEEEEEGDGGRILRFGLW